MMKDEDLDTLLCADAQAGPDDGGFTLGVMARLRPRRTPRASRLPRRLVQVLALSTALFGFCLLWPGVADAWVQAQSGGDAALGGGVLLLLAVWWTLPQARINPWG